MSLAGAGFGGMSIAEVYTLRKLHRETMEASATVSIAGEKDCSGGGRLREVVKPPARRSGRWFSVKKKKNSAKVLDLIMTTE